MRDEACPQQPCLARRRLSLLPAVYEEGHYATGIHQRRPQWAAEGGSYSPATCKRCYGTCGGWTGSVPPLAHHQTSMVCPILQRRVSTRTSILDPHVRVSNGRGAARARGRGATCVMCSDSHQPWRDRFRALGAATRLENARLKDRGSGGVPGTGGRWRCAPRRAAALASEVRRTACTGWGSGWGDATVALCVVDFPEVPPGQSSEWEGLFGRWIPGAVPRCMRGVRVGRDSSWKEAATATACLTC